MGRPFPRDAAPSLPPGAAPWVALTADGGVPVFLDNVDRRLVLLRAGGAALVALGIVCTMISGRPLAEEPLLEQRRVPARVELPVAGWEAPGSRTAAAPADPAVPDQVVPRAQYVVPPAVQPRSVQPATRPKPPAPPRRPTQPQPAAPAAAAPRPAPVVEQRPAVALPPTESVPQYVVSAVEPVVAPVTSLARPVTALARPVTRLLGP